MKLNIYVIIFGGIALLLVLGLILQFVIGNNGNLGARNGTNLSLANLTNYGPAPQLAGIANWINSPSLNLTQLKGKVVLIDFWTYSCINCIRTIPHLNAWYSEYGANNGLVIIGVETPEFAFEANAQNVEMAVKGDGIKYPVAEDNNYSTWIAYNNHYWPADYLIDKNGDVRYVSFGEGDYNQTEATIRLLLENAGYSVPGEISNVTGNKTQLTQGVNFSQIESEELYLGASTYREPIGNAEGFHQNETVNYTPVNAMEPNIAYFEGSWYNAPDSMIAVNNSKLFLVYHAKYVNIVASGPPSNISIKLDNQTLNATSLGIDVKMANGDAIATINGSRLYNIVDTGAYGTHVLEIDANKGFRIYTFTFG